MLRRSIFSLVGEGRWWGAMMKVVVVLVWWLWEEAETKRMVVGEASSRGDEVEFAEKKETTHWLLLLLYGDGIGKRRESEFVWVEGSRLWWLVFGAVGSGSGLSRRRKRRLSSFPFLFYFFPFDFLRKIKEPANLIFFLVCNAWNIYV